MPTRSDRVGINGHITGFYTARLTWLTQHEGVEMLGAHPHPPPPSPPPRIHTSARKKKDDSEIYIMLESSAAQHEKKNLPNLSRSSLRGRTSHVSVLWDIQIVIKYHGDSKGKSCLLLPMMMDTFPSRATAMLRHQQQLRGGRAGSPAESGTTEHLFLFAVFLKRCSSLDTCLCHCM